jgi:hypothetical protein
MVFNVPVETNLIQNRELSIGLLASKESQPMKKVL